jgi:hypothetical protein
LVSIGSQASTSAPYCVETSEPNTTGPQLSNYRALILSAFQAAGASPILEEDLGRDAAADSSTLEDAGPEASDVSEGGDGAIPYGDDGPAADAQPSPPVAVAVKGGSCAIGFDPRERWSPAGGAMGLALAMTVAAMGRRKRRP